MILKPELLLEVSGIAMKAKNAYFQAKDLELAIKGDGRYVLDMEEERSLKHLKKTIFELRRASRRMERHRLWLVERSKHNDQVDTEEAKGPLPSP